MKIPPSIIHAWWITLDKTLFQTKDPEFWHNIVMQKMDCWEKVDWILKTLEDSLYLEDRSLNIEIWNIEMKNPVWIAAGLVKEPHWLKFLEALGVWFITIWWITKEAQPWNKPQRVFKLNNDIVNWMWLPWNGWKDVVKMLEERIYLWMMPWIPIIANLCNSACNVSDEGNIEEFCFLMEKLYPYVGGFEINVSCPNQEWVTTNQKEGKLRKILTRVMKSNEKLAIQNWCKKKTILVKIAPLTQKENVEEAKDLTPK